MAYRRSDGGFGSGLGGGFGTSGGYDPHRRWEGPYTTRGVARDGSRVARTHDDEQPHFSEEAARMQHGYGLSQYPTSDWDSERGPHYGKGPKGYRRSDDRIRDEVCEVMSRQGFIDASDVEVTVEGGVVRLTGTVASRADKRGLEMIADRVHGVDEVRNEIRLKHLVTRAEASTRAPGSQRDVGPVSQNGTGSRSAHS